ncbi:MAG: D-erythronate dehydrogenase [Opitutaceae bacterium]
MKIIITGGAGFLGQRLAKRLLETMADSSAPFRLVLIDRVATHAFDGDSRVQSVVGDIADRAELQRLVTPDTAVIYHLAAIVSSQAEAEFDLGMRINFEATHSLLEIARQLPAPPKFVFTSSVAVFGGALPAIVTDDTAVHPQSSYGAQKAVGELLVNDYSRKGFVDGRVLRLPTICVRPGKPNRAASSFVSGIIREPLNGEPAVCPVMREVRLWLSSPATAIENLLHAQFVPAQSLALNRTINLPGLAVTVGEMLDTLERVAGREAVAKVRFERDEAVEKIVTSWPGRFDPSRALSLGFLGDEHFEAVVRAYRQEAFPNGSAATAHV